MHLHTFPFSLRLILKSRTIRRSLPCRGTSTTMQMRHHRLSPHYPTARNSPHKTNKKRAPTHAGSKPASPAPTPESTDHRPHTQHVEPPIPTQRHHHRADPRRRRGHLAEAEVLPQRVMEHQRRQTEAATLSERPSSRLSISMSTSIWSLIWNLSLFCLCS